MTMQYPVQTMDLAALRHNLRAIRATLPEKTMLLAVIKADAYGHGSVQVARSALAAGASWLAVARACEGTVLRDAGIAAPILVLGASTDAEVAEGVRCGLTLAVINAHMVHVAQRCADEMNREALIHLKIDTGMGRIGMRTEAEIRQVLAALAESHRVRLTGAFTHFADADGEDDVYTRMQFEHFCQLAALLPAGIIRHCANSAGIHRYPEMALDMVRAGISMYGYPPVPTDLDLCPVMDWRTEVTCVKPLQPGEKVSYGCTFTADKPMLLATVACGYGDGYHRCATGKAEVIIRGQRCPVVGRICMDQMMVDVTHVPQASAGDEAVLIGRCGEAVITAEDLAAWCGTISYEVLLAATQRVHKRWIHEVDD